MRVSPFTVALLMPRSLLALISLLSFRRVDMIRRSRRFFLIQAISAAATTALLATAHARRQRQLMKAEEAHRLFAACPDLLNPERPPLPTTLAYHRVLSRLGAERGVVVAGLEAQPASPSTTDSAATSPSDTAIRQLLPATPRTSRSSLAGRQTSKRFSRWTGPRFRLDPPT